MEYKFEIFFPGEDGYDENDVVDLIVRKGGEEYTGTLVPLKALISLFPKNRSTGECGEGSYFCMPKMVVVKDLRDDTIRKTLDDLIETDEFQYYFD